MGKLDKIYFDRLSEFFAQHDKIFGKKKQVGEDVFLTEASTSKSSTQSSRGRGAQFSSRGRGNQDQSAYRGQGQGRSQVGGRGNNQGRGRGRGSTQGRENTNFQRGSNNFRRIQSKRPQNRNNQYGRGRHFS
jgi:hypothetical protein